MFQFIGKLVTQMREEKSLTKEELSKKCSITVEKLNEIESGKITPSVAIMIRISRALGSRLGTLLDGHENCGAVVTRAKQAVKNENPVGSTDTHGENKTFASLAVGKNDRHMEPFIIDLANNPDVENKYAEHEGEEFLYILDGTVEVAMGSEVYKLERGDSIYYDSIVPHKISCVCPVSAKILSVVYTPY